MTLQFLVVGGNKEPWLDAFADEYIKKIGYFYPTEIRQLKPAKHSRSSKEHKQQEESEQILKALSDRDLLLLCSEEGQQVDSRGLSKKLVQLVERGKPRLVVLVGGAYGVGPEVRARADWVWSFSKLTLNHPLAQAVAMEQVYRAFMIWKNRPYHND